MLVLTLALVVNAGSACAQSAARHGVTLSVPSFAGIRIVGAGAGTRAVTFDFEAEPAEYVSALLSGEPLPPTSVDRFEDIHLSIAANGRWNVWVYATPLSTPSGGGDHGLALANIRVVAGLVSNLQPVAVVGPGASSSFAGTWVLAVNPEPIARGVGRTSGWRSLGFNGYDYLLDVDGDETPGVYSTIVTYSLALP